MKQHDLFGCVPLSFEDEAEKFLRRWARKNRRCAFSPEVVISAAVRAGIVVDDARKWGPIFAKAAKEGVIRPEGLFPRATSNGSMRPGWIGV